MGALGTAAQACVTATVHACAKIAKLEVIKDGIAVYSVTPGILDTELIWTDPEDLKSEHSYYLRVTQEDRQMAWASPVWLRSIYVHL
jgi:NAD(P)-dependent dehydrogenase (short-subunit alcohol dehydrogenase family)